MTVYNNGWQPGQRFGLPSQNQMGQTALNTGSGYQMPLLPTSQSAGLNSMPAYNTGAPDMQTMLATMGSMVAAMTTSVMALITAVMQRRTQATPAVPNTPQAPTESLAPTPTPLAPKQDKDETDVDTEVSEESPSTDSPSSSKKTEKKEKDEKPALPKNNKEALAVLEKNLDTIGRVDATPTGKKLNDYETFGIKPKEGTYNLFQLRRIAADDSGKYSEELVDAAKRVTNNETLASKIDNIHAGKNERFDGYFTKKDLTSVADASDVNELKNKGPGKALSDIKMPKIEGKKDHPNRKKLDDALKYLKTDPDGSRLLNEAGKKGYKIVISDKKKDVPIAECGKDTLTLYPATFDNEGGTAYVVEVLGHELSHAAASGKNHDDTKNEEALGSTLGRRIRARYEDKPYSIQDERKSYVDGVNTAKHNKSYKDLKEGSEIFGKLKKIGIQFDFSTDVPNNDKN